MNEYNERILKNVLDDYSETQDKEFLKEIDEANNDPRFARTTEKDAEFEKLLNKETKKADRKANVKKNLIRAASIVLVICLGFTVMTFTVQGFREKIWNFFASLGSSTHYSLNASTDDGVKLLETYEGKYIPSWIPHGYTVDNVQNSEGLYTIEMSKGKEALTYMENDIDSVFGVDNEQIEKHEEVNINGDKAVKSEKDGKYYLTLKKGKSLIQIMATDEELNIVGFAELIEEK